jgi:integrase
MTPKQKPPKPYDDFPLYPHGNGQWAKKIKGQLRYFGKWSDPDAALELYELQREALYAGREPSRPSVNLSVADACNFFLGAKDALCVAGELTNRTLVEYTATCNRILAEFGRERTVPSLVAADFDALRKSLAKRMGPVSLGNEVNRVRMVFRYAVEADLIDRAVRFGPNFKRPSAKVLRLERIRRGKRLFTAAELRMVLDEAREPLRTIIHLAINCGLGNADIGRLSVGHLDLKGRWLNYPRPKTGMDRRARLWPETVAGLIKILAKRKKPRNEKNAGLVFLTRHGNSWGEGEPGNILTREFSKLLIAAEVNRPGLNFYALRHTFQTVGEECGDLPAVRYVMGHVPPASDMSSVYREALSDERLTRVASHVRKWLQKKEKTRQRAS